MDSLNTLFIMLALSVDWSVALFFYRKPLTRYSEDVLAFFADRQPLHMAASRKDGKMSQAQAWRMLGAVDRANWDTVRPARNEPSSVRREVVSFWRFMGAVCGLIVLLTSLFCLLWEISDSILLAAVILYFSDGPICRYISKMLGVNIERLSCRV